MVRGIKFVGIPVRDQDVSLNFYTRAMGLRVVPDQPFTDMQRWIELLIPGAETRLALYTPDGHERRIGEFQSIACWCDDVFAPAKVLKSKGAIFAQEPKSEPWGSVAIFRDPDGSQLGKKRVAKMAYEVFPTLSLYFDSDVLSPVVRVSCRTAVLSRSAYGPTQLLEVRHRHRAHRWLVQDHCQRFPS
jgi:catechol 2,3-dioxygenase-like lactoylglutathione lyase family enzyme